MPDSQRKFSPTIGGAAGTWVGGTGAVPEGVVGTSCESCCKSLAVALRCKVTEVQPMECELVHIRMEDSTVYRSALEERYCSH